MTTWAVIPVKTLRQTKSRLTAVLSPSERAALTQQMLRHTIDVLQNAGVVDSVLVVSRDTAVVQLATQQDARTLAEPPDAGLNGAVQAGCRLAALNQAERVLVLPADLPFLTTADVALVLANNSANNIVICPDRHEQGTNALLLPAQAVFEFQFGPDSFRKHVAAARVVGVEYGRSTPLIVRSPGWQFDLDTVEDWAIYSQEALSPS